jgi:hypothetical protein
MINLNTIPVQAITSLPAPQALRLCLGPEPLAHIFAKTDEYALRSHIRKMLAESIAEYDQLYTWLAK